MRFKLRWTFRSSPPSAPYMHQWIGSTLVQIMSCPLIGARPLSKSMLSYWKLEQTSVTLNSKYKTFVRGNASENIDCKNSGSFVPRGDELAKYTIWLVTTYQLCIVLGYWFYVLPFVLDLSTSHLDKFWTLSTGVYRFLMCTYSSKEP